nr:hypothetical protein [uncultured Cohaesibacter sp.]
MEFLIADYFAGLYRQLRPGLVSFLMMPEAALELAFAIDHKLLKIGVQMNGSDYD